MRSFIVVAALFTFLTAAYPANADVAARYVIGREGANFRSEMTVEVDEHENVRVQMNNAPTYFLMIGEAAYVVSRGHDGPFVVDMNHYVTLAGELASRIGGAMPSDFPKSDQRLVGMGSREVGGRSGVAYGLATGANSNRRAQSEIVVISDDPTLSPIGRAFARSLRQSASNLVNASGIGAQALGGLGTNLAESLGSGAPLRLFMMTLTETSTADIPEERFALPAEPLSLDAFRAMSAPFDPPPTLTADAPPAGE